MMSKVPLLLFLLSVSGAQGASLCETGSKQSPIDIRSARREHLAGLDFAYISVPLKLTNDGHTVRVRLKNAGQLKIGQARYTLDQFHFHTPGGDRIEGEEFPIAAHILHRSTSGQLLGLVVPMRMGANNALLDKLFPRIPLKPGDTDLVPSVQVSAAELLPAQKGYYRYVGSLTSEPCTEGVEWVVLKHPLEISASQLAQYKMKFADNMRGPQALHNRDVLESP